MSPELVACLKKVYGTSGVSKSGSFGRRDLLYLYDYLLFYPRLATFSCGDIVSPAVSEISVAYPVFRERGLSQNFLDRTIGGRPCVILKRSYHSRYSLTTGFPGV